MPTHEKHMKSMPAKMPMQGKPMMTGKDMAMSKMPEQAKAHGVRGNRPATGKKK